jgi:hypothetical protein
LLLISAATALSEASGEQLTSPQCIASATLILGGAALVRSTRESMRSDSTIGSPGASALGRSDPADNYAMRVAVWPAVSGQ